MDRNCSCFTVGFLEDLVSGLGLHEGLAAVVPAVDKGPDLIIERQAIHRGTFASVRELMIAEPDLDEVERRP